MSQAKSYHFFTHCFVVVTSVACVEISTEHEQRDCYGAT